MSIAALITFIVAATGGFVMLGQWVSRGGARAGSTITEAPTSLSPIAVFGHFLLAVMALVLWLVYLVADSTALAWVVFGVLIIVAALGISVLLRWRVSGCPIHRASAEHRPERPESHFKVPVVLGHGAFAVATVALVLLVALKV